MRNSESVSGRVEREMSRRIPVRMCAVCRELKSRDSLFRLVKAAEETKFGMNERGVFPGRGLYLCRSEVCLQRMHKERRLRRQLLERIDPTALSYMMQESRESETCQIQ